MAIQGLHFVLTANVIVFSFQKVLLVLAKKKYCCSYLLTYMCTTMPCVLQCHVYSHVHMASALLRQKCPNLRWYMLACTRVGCAVM